MATISDTREFVGSQRLSGPVVVSFGSGES